MSVETKLLSITSLVPDPDNARTHPKENLEAITKSLRRFGQVEPMVVQKSTSIVIGGNGRLEAMRAMNAEAEAAGEKPPWPRVRAAIVSVTNDERRALALALNRTGELAGWDEKQLTETITYLMEHDFEVGDLGWSSEDLEAIAQQFEVDSAEMPDLDATSSPFSQITFTLTHEQMAIVRSALDVSKGNGNFGDTGNSNANGNAIARICAQYCEQ